MVDKIKVNSISFNVQPVREVGKGIVGYLHYPTGIHFTQYSDDARTRLEGEHALSTNLTLKLADLVSEIENEIAENLTK